MRPASARLLAALGLLLCFGAAQAVDLGEALRKQLEERLRPPQPGQPTPPAPAQPAEKPWLGDLKGLLGGYSEEEEVAIGRQIAGSLLGASPLVKDKALQRYVNQVGRWVASQSERPDLPWHFGVIESGDVNAFSMPGGYVFITRGLYRRLESEADLAGVLAHEVGHVIRRHHLKILQQSRLVDIGGRLVARRAGENEQIRRLIGTGAEVVARSLDKDAEFEADRIAVVLAARAGYDPFGLPEVLQDIGHFAADDGAVALLFKTHPHPDDRLTQLGLAMDDRFDRVKGLTLPKRLYRLKP